MMGYWILKTEPGAYSFSDLERDGETIWDGVRNHQARNNLNMMKKGDLAMIYHSVGPKEAVGIAQVITEAFPDETAVSKEWLAVKIRFHRWLSHPITLARMKSEPRLRDLGLVKQSRLSVCPVTYEEWRLLLEMSKTTR